MDWFMLAVYVANINISCLEGFIKSSAKIIKKTGLYELEEWLEIGISLAETSSKVAITYFGTTSDVFLSVGYDRFKNLSDIGIKLAKQDAQVSECYFKNLPFLQRCLLHDYINDFAEVVKGLAISDRKSAIDLIENTESVFKQIPSFKKRKFLYQVKKTACIDTSTAHLLYHKSGYILYWLTESEFDQLVNFVIEFAKIDPNVACSFLNACPEFFKKVETSEVFKWSNIGMYLIQKNVESSKAFFDKLLDNIDLMKENFNQAERVDLIYKSADFALSSWVCLDDFFKSLPAIYNILSKSEFYEWLELGKNIALHNSIIGSAFYRDSTWVIVHANPRYRRQIFKTGKELLSSNPMIAGLFFNALPEASDNLHLNHIDEWAKHGLSLYNIDQKIAASYFEHTPSLLKDIDIIGVKDWTQKGIELFYKDFVSGRLYFNLESRKSREVIGSLSNGVELEKVQKTLKYYTLGLSGINYKIYSKNMISDFDTPNPVVYNNIIYLKPRVNLFDNPEYNFRFYKLCLIHEIAHKLYGSDLISALKNNRSGITYHEILSVLPEKNTDNNFDLQTLTSRFIYPKVIEDIFTIIEDARVEYKIMESYRGLYKDFKLRYLLLSKRSLSKDVPEIFVDSLLWVTCGYRPSSNKRDVQCLIDFSKSVLNKMVFHSESSVIESFVVACKIYNKIKELLNCETHLEYNPIQNLEYRSVEFKNTIKTSKETEKPGMEDLEYTSPVTYVQASDKAEETCYPHDHITPKSPSCTKNIIASYRYDEWDERINDYKYEWCIVNEVEPDKDTSNFYEETLESYIYEINYLKKVFSSIKPEDYQMLKRQSDGDEIDIDSVIDSLVEKKYGSHPNEDFYIKNVKKERDVATLFLVDVSASTQKKLGMGGKTILDIEKEALIVMSHALENIGDKYAIYAFSGTTHRNVEYYVVKKFDEGLSTDMKSRISALEPISNTRLGPAIRHSIKKHKDIEAKTKLIILISDGEPYDFGTNGPPYQGDFAERDTKMAIREGYEKGIHFFCVTVDKEAKDYMDSIFSDAGYTIIDDVALIPERLPMIYKKLTT
ncbi:nitric oxide reductase activation protein NorD [Methanohalobium evestigatum]|uniref:nitric oxide reductase activation protein NorD n=1 Tax=Methanohalobium evestigatum TaxID=2322 RepID=UPI0012F621DA|nr:VWA domain-containing protein [Methanohalobium evestigatum]